MLEEMVEKLKSGMIIAADVVTDGADNGQLVRRRPIKKGECENKQANNWGNRRRIFSSTQISSGGGAGV